MDELKDDPKPGDPQVKSHSAADQPSFPPEPPAGPPVATPAEARAEETPPPGAGAERPGCPGGPCPAGNAGGEKRPHVPTRVVRVLVRGHHRLSLTLAGEHHLALEDVVVIQTSQGKAIAVVKDLPIVLPLPAGDHARLLRKAAPDDLARDLENQKLEEKAFEYCFLRIAEWELSMKLIRVDFHFDRSKAVFSFTAEKRVDFRELVRDLARQFHCRIEMRQIGIRDEARALGGIGPCGMVYCCTAFLKEFAPISVKMAKDQNVILNPGKISGGCGRLLCCLGYEFETYEEFARDLPKIGKKVDLPQGRGKIRNWDIFSRTVTVELADGGIVTLPLEEFKGILK